MLSPRPWHLKGFKYGTHHQRPSIVSVSKNLNPHYLLLNSPRKLFWGWFYYLQRFSHSQTKIHVNSYRLDQSHLRRSSLILWIKATSRSQILNFHLGFQRFSNFSFILSIADVFPHREMWICFVWVPEDQRCWRYVKPLPWGFVYFINIIYKLFGEGRGCKEGERVYSKWYIHIDFISLFTFTYLVQIINPLKDLGLKRWRNSLKFL